MMKHLWQFRGGVILWGSCVALMVCAGCESGQQTDSAFRPERHPRTAEKARELVGVKAADVLAGADRVEVYRIIGRPVEQPVSAPATREAAAGKAKIEGYEIIERGKDQGKQFAAELNRLVVDAGNYLVDGKSCLPIPGVVYRATKGDSSATIVVCYECKMLRVIAHEGDGPAVPSDWLDFDPIQKELVKLATQAFPSDEKIRNLK